MNEGSAASYLTRTPCVRLFDAYCIDNGSAKTGAFKFEGGHAITSVVQRNLGPVMFSADCLA